MTNLTTLRQTIQIPFCGFYESPAMEMIEEEIRQAFDPEGTGEDNVPENFWNHWDSKKVEQAFCRLYVEAFAEYLKDKMDIDIHFEFQELTSPKFYNFETDRIFAWVSHVDVCKLYNITNTPSLRMMVSERHTSCSGFISFYSNDLDDKDGEWGKDLHDWDSVQLQTLLMAAMAQEDIPEDFYAIMEDKNCNGEMDNVVWLNIGGPCLDMLEEYEAKHKAA